VALSPRATAVLAKNRIRDIALSLTHDHVSASSVALALADATEAPLSGRLIFRLLPFRRRVVLHNLRRVFGVGVADAEIERLAQAHYAHLCACSSNLCASLDERAAEGRAGQGR